MASGNNGRTENLIPFKPGQSGNPNGRPKGIARQARDLIKNDPARLLNVLLEVAENPKAKPLERVAATNAYLDRAYGKAPAFAPIDGENPLELDSIDRAIEAIVDELAVKREAAAPGPPPERAVAATGTD